MRRALLVADREFRQVVATRGFWILLLMVPLAITVTVIAAAFAAPPPALAYVIVDPADHVASALERRLTLDWSRQTIAALSAWEARWVPGAPPAGGDLNDEQAAAFIARGGAPAALAEVRARAKPGAPPFEGPKPRFVRIVKVEAPTDAGPDAFGAAIAPRLKQEMRTPFGPRVLALAVWIPRDLDPGGPPVRMWSASPGAHDLADLVRSEASRAERLEAMRDLGVDVAAAQRIDSINPEVRVEQPAAPRRKPAIVLHSALPIVLVYLLLASAMTTGSMMLQGVIEERSNKLLEAVLACVRPGELMMGKLIGLGGVGLTIMGVWTGCAVAGGLALHGPAAALLHEAIRPLDHPWMIPALLFYFASGYLIISAIFLAIGSMSDSLQDAQAWLMPTLMSVMTPVIVMMDAAVLDPATPWAQVMTWIPLYTPFAMLARLGAGVSRAEVLGSGALLILFIWLELALLGRIFRVSLLAAGQRPPMAALARMIFGSRRQDLAVGHTHRPGP